MALDTQIAYWLGSMLDWVWNLTMQPAAHGRRAVSTIIAVSMWVTNVEGLTIHGDCLPEAAHWLARLAHFLRRCRLERSSPVPSTSVAAGLRERKKRAVKAALEQTALRLFMEKGYENTTVEEISEAVDVSTRTFFRYFATKDEVLFAHQAERLAALRGFFSERPADAPLADTVQAVVDFFAEDLEANADLLVVQATVYAEARLPAGIIRLRQDELIEAIAVGAWRRARSLRWHPTRRHATATMCAIELAARVVPGRPAG